MSQFNVSFYQTIYIKICSIIRVISLTCVWIVSDYTIQ